MDAFNIFKTDKGNDSDEERPSNRDIFGYHKTPVRSRNMSSSRDLGLSQSNKARHHIGRSMNRINQEPSTNKMKKFKASFLRPVNTLDNELDKKRQQAMEACAPTSSAEKAGNDDQENNDANWNDPDIDEYENKKQPKTVNNCKEM